MAQLRQNQPRRLGYTRSRHFDREPGFHTRGRYSKKRKKTVLLLGITQVILGLIIIGISFSVFALTSASRIRHASPCWAGFALLFTGGVGVIAWRQPSSLSLGFYTVLSCLCILLHLVATTLAGLGGMELQSIKNCETSVEKESCLCCTSNSDCSDGIKVLMYAGTTTCHMLQKPMLRNIMFANCLTNILAIVLCITTSSVGFILALKRQRTQRIISRGYTRGHHGFINPAGMCSSIPTGDAHEQFSPIPFLPPPYAPPHYNEISNDPVVMQSEDYVDDNASPNVIIDPGELPPPYSTLDHGQVTRNGRSRSSRRSRSSQVLENPHSEGHTRLPAPPSHISRGCSTQDTPPPPPVRWDSHGWEVRPFCVDSQSVHQTIAMGRGLVTEYPGQELVTTHGGDPTGRPCNREQEITVGQNNLDNPELYITENPLLPLAEAKTPLQIHMATRCQNITMYLPENRPVRVGSHSQELKKERAKVVAERGRRHSHTGGRSVATDVTRPKKESSVKIKRRRSRRTRSLQSASSGSSRQYSSSSDSEEERLRAACPRRKPQKSSSTSEGSSLKDMSDCRFPSTSESTINHDSRSTRSKSGSDVTISISRESSNHGLLCPPRLASSERLTLTDNSSLEERLMALRQSYESLTNSSTQGTLVDTSSLRPNSLNLKSNSPVREASTSSPNSEYSNPWILRSRSNTSEGVSFASSSITLTSEASGASNEMKHGSQPDIAPEVITMQNGVLLPPFPVAYSQEKVQLLESKTPFILDNDKLPFKEDITNINSLNISLQTKLDNFTNKNRGNENGGKPRPKSVAEVNHETRVVLKQLLMEIEEDVDSPIKTLLNDIQGMLKSDEHCLVDLQHSANIVNHIMNQKETNGISESLEKINIANKKTMSDTAVLKSLEMAKETIL